MYSVQIDNLIRTKRRTFSLQVHHDATLTVRAPIRASDGDIYALLYKKLDWIYAKQDAARKRFSKPGKKEFVNGEGFLYLGRLYKLEVNSSSEVALKFDDKFYLEDRFKNNAKKVFTDWYKQAAYDKIYERCEYYSKKCGLKLNKVNITNARKRWGSCGAADNLNFSWRLIMAPLRVIDYVVVHEMAHIEEKNHSKKFWNKVKALMPDYGRQKKWLEDNGHLLKI